MCRGGSACTLEREGAAPAQEHLGPGWPTAVAREELDGLRHVGSLLPRILAARRRSAPCCSLGAFEAPLATHHLSRRAESRAERPDPQTSCTARWPLPCSVHDASVGSFRAPMLMGHQVHARRRPSFALSRPFARHEGPCLQAAEFARSRPSQRVHIATDCPLCPNRSSGCSACMPPSACIA